MQYKKLWTHDWLTGSQNVLDNILETLYKNLENFTDLKPVCREVRILTHARTHTHTHTHTHKSTPTEIDFVSSCTGTPGSAPHRRDGGVCEEDDEEEDKVEKQ